MTCRHGRYPKADAPACQHFGYTVILDCNGWSVIGGLSAFTLSRTDFQVPLAAVTPISADLGKLQQQQAKITQGHMLCRSASLPRTVLQAPLRLPAAVMCGAASKSAATAPAAKWSDTPLAKSQYAKELGTACLAVQLASKLCRTVQQQLSSSETAGKQDDSPVTVADYGKLSASAHYICIAAS